MTFRNQRVLVFGGSSGIGRACAEAFLAAGAAVTLAARGRERLDAVAKEIGAACVVADVCDLEAVAAALAPGFDHVVVSAAPPAERGSFLEVGPAGIATCLTGKAQGQAQATLLAARAVRRGGSVTVITGVAGRKPMVSLAAVGMANAAIEAMVPVLAAEVGPTRVNAVSPGLTETNSFAAMPEAARKAFFDEVAGALPVGRVGRPEELAQAVLMLAGNGFATGTVLEVDGGARLA